MKIIYKYLCFLGFHFYKITNDNVNYKLSDQYNRRKELMGIYHFRKCSCCGKMQYKVTQKDFSAKYDWDKLSIVAKSELKFYQSL